MKVFIFDLDQTLIETDFLESYRKERNWPKVYELIESSNLKIYDGLSEVLLMAKEFKISVAIVTSSPRTYAVKLLNKVNLQCDTLICYHDTTLKKPNPEPIIKALEILIIPKNEYHNVLSFGDRDIDIIASKRAGVLSVACYWGSKDIQSLDLANPNYKAYQPKDIINIFRK
jgi:phosphoglycolate phosphatase-like HAD superfamily hydrolase